ncbi:LuxR C-terminal-related transcriptional regulator [Flavobacterium sp.]|uniref:response regulator transcription factor n=1 Tax=Flavobacterium sp. TaxID=239 RepID=UPI002605DA23|nr:LuxR C-terminal-related transcriptional regulator [Flavobacterium sp.]
MLLTFKKYKESIGYGISLALLFFLLRWLELRLLIFSHQFEVYVGAIAILFTALGVWLTNKITSPKVETIIVEKEVLVRDIPFTRNEETLSQLKISKRELEVLTLMAAGKSNQEIAALLFVSLSTVKSHAANLFEKLDVKRRTQAIETAKKRHILP